MSALPPKSDAECVHSNVRLEASADLLNDLPVLIRRCRIKAAFNTSSNNGFELRVRHTLRNWGNGGLELSRYQQCNHWQAKQL